MQLTLFEEGIVISSCHLLLTSHNFGIFDCKFYYNIYLQSFFVLASPLIINVPEPKGSRQQDGNKSLGGE